METRFLLRGNERIAYDLQGERGPLVICVPGMGDLRAEYRFLAPSLVAAGYRVATMDVRGHGESSTGWDDYSAAAVGSDVVALVTELGGPAFLVGTSMAGGAAVWAAAEAPAQVSGVVLIGPFVRDVPIGALTRALMKVLFAPPWGGAAWTMYYKSLYPSAQPSDFGEYRARLGKNLREPGRMAALRAMLAASKADCEARLPSVKAPALVVMGSRDPDFKDPLAEAQRVAQSLGGDIYVADGAGHYPHAEQPAATATRIVAFLRAPMGRPRAGRELDAAQVVEAAALLCDRDGWDALSLHALAATLGIRPPSLYNHVDGLPALRRQLARLARNELRERFLVAAAGQSGADGLRALAGAYRAFARERPGLYPAVVTQPEADDPEAAASALAVVEVVAAVLAPYRLGASELIHAIRAFRAALHGFVTLEQARGFGLPQKIDDSYARLVELFIAGLATMGRSR